MTILGGSSGFGPRGGDGKPPEVPVVTERDFEAKVLRSELPVLLEFFSARSAVSKQVATEVAAFAKDMTGKVAVYRVDADKSPIIVRQLRVQQIPTFMLFAEQRVADAQVGPLRKRDLQAMVEPFLPRQAGALKVPEVAQLLQKGAIAMVDTRDAGAFGRAHEGGLHLDGDHAARVGAFLGLARQPRGLRHRHVEHRHQHAAVGHLPRVHVGFGQVHAQLAGAALHDA